MHWVKAVTSLAQLASEAVLHVGLALAQESWALS
jgi:hypothetical protein